VRERESREKKYEKEGTKRKKRRNKKMKGREWGSGKK
jgi:hypothetical protein